ncbi:apolipoprotein N-acyltransferase [Calothrix sp. UHCC 0171]|uniref:apolipoprotein N-acyltransferase n=1 Tax=Calothrix sp. UHCC 0171 TaxID=3110245 RepID=UPI002B221740|nr:apolipoprotein N-acyltransferase [Calothrix sp. UHCC 0171]MEA5569622.1 apolipoprotein N-acyltransferase [Calothrix sp. UHCC 0171]
MNLKNLRQFATQNSKLIIALVSGVLMGITVAPFNVWFLAWFALSPLWVLVLIHKKSPRIAGKNHISPFSLALLPLLWGIGYHGTALFWITGIHPMTWMGVPWLASIAIAFFVWTFITLWGAALVTIWAISLFWIHQQFTSQNPQSKTLAFTPLIRVLIATAIWCGLEKIWSLGPLWWSSISYTQSPYNLVILHLGQLTGTSAITAAIVAINGLIAEAFLVFLSKSPHPSASFQLLVKKSPVNKYLTKYLTIAAGLFITLHLIGYSLYSRPLPQAPATALKIGIIQGNIPNTIKLFPEGFRRAIQGYTNGYLTLAAQNVDAVLTPEGALPFYLRDIQQGSLVKAIREKGVVAWIGGFGERGNSYNNSLFTFTGKGEVFSRYDKHKLVPLGEYIPFEEILGGIINRLSPLEAHQVPGASNQLFNTPFGRAIIGICYESAFPEQFRRQAAAGGEFILSAANNAHYSKAMPAQHHAQDIMRAIETDRWAVRATNTGYSGFVNPHGKTLWISGHNTYETHAEIIYKQQTKTLYVRWGDWLTPSLLGLSILALCLHIFSPKDDFHQ